MGMDCSIFLYRNSFGATLEGHSNIEDEENVQTDKKMAELLALINWKALIQGSLEPVNV